MRRAALVVTPFVVAALAAVGVASTASASEAAKTQRILIQEKGRTGSYTGKFSFAALTSGALERDAGTYTYAVAEKPSVMRDGQSVARYVVVDTFAGKQGTFAIRLVLAVVGAGNGYRVGTGTWSFVRGTGAYAAASGRGRVAIVEPLSGVASAQFEGFLISG